MPFFFFVSRSMAGVFFRWSSLCSKTAIPLWLKAGWSPFAYSQNSQWFFIFYKDFGNFLWETKSELHNTSLPFWGKICTKTQLISRTRWKYLLHPSSRRISLLQNRPNLKPACGGALHRKADSIQSNGPRQHTTLYEIRWLLKSFSQIKN